MTSVLLLDPMLDDPENGLPSNVIFDKVQRVESKMPEIVVPGSDKNNRNLANKSQLYGECDIPIIADPPNFCNEIGGIMSENSVERFIKIPRQLFEDSNWKGLRLKYQKLFLIILEHVAYRPRIYKHNGNSITVAPGQLCVSFRRLADIFNEDVKWKDERIDAPLVQRAVSVFSKFGFSIHESIHGIMRITITHKELYEHFKNMTDTPSDTQPIQNRYTNEERKEGKERDIKETNRKNEDDGADAPDSSLLDFEKREEKKKSSIITPEISHGDLSPEKQKHYKFLWDFIVKNSMCHGQTSNGKPGVKQKDLMAWVTKYEGKEIFECLKITLEKIPNQTWPGYVTKLLVDKIPKKEEDSKNGKKLVEEYIKYHNIKHIDMKQDYFKDLISDESSYYNLPRHTLEAILNRSRERALEKEAEDQRFTDYDSDY